MPAPIAKLIPSATLVVIFGYLTWSYLEMAPTPPPPASKLPELSKKILEPKPPESTARDPFGDSVRFELGELKKDDARDRKFGKPAGGAKPDASTAAKGAKPPQNAATPPAPAAAKPPAAPAPPPETRTASKEELTDLVSGLALSATVLRGSEGFAVINGREYRTGQTVNTSMAEAKLVVSEIQRHRVVLKEGDVDFVLKYADRNVGEKSARGAGPKPPAAGRPGAAAKPKSPASGRGAPAGKQQAKS